MKPLAVDHFRNHMRHDLIPLAQRQRRDPHDLTLDYETQASRRRRAHFGRRLQDHPRSGSIGLQDPAENACYKYQAEAASRLATAIARAVI